MRLILYGKPGCHLCEGLQEILEDIHTPAVELEVRDITTNEDWFQAFQYEIPVVFWENMPDALLRLPRISPRASVEQVAQMLQKVIMENASQ